MGPHVDFVGDVHIADRYSLYKCDIQVTALPLSCRLSGLNERKVHPGVDLIEDALDL